jgi:hypothetical protein
MPWRSRHRHQPPPRGGPRANFIMGRSLPGGPGTECMVMAGRRATARARALHAVLEAKSAPSVIMFFLMSRSAISERRPPRCLLTDFHRRGRPASRGAAPPRWPDGPPRCPRTARLAARAAPPSATPKVIPTAGHVQPVPHARRGQWRQVHRSCISSCHPVTM